MAMAVVCVGEMGVVMRYRFVLVRMRVLLAGGHDKPRLIGVAVQVVFVVRVFMLVIHGLMDMGVVMHLRQVQPNTQAHQ